MIIYQSEATTNELVAPVLRDGSRADGGTGVLGAIEYRGESHGWPRKGWIIRSSYHALEPFPQAFLIKSIFSGRTLVHIGVVDSKTDTLTWNDIVVGLQPSARTGTALPAKNIRCLPTPNAESGTAGERQNRSG
jgi:beta-galactosidase